MATGRALDHLFTSKELRPVAAVYHHEWRDEGLSDHSPLEVDLSPRAPTLSARQSAGGEAARPASGA